MTPRDKEKLDVLVGERGDPNQAAVRVTALRQLVDSVPVDPTGVTATDIKALYAAINALRIALR